MAHVFTLSLFIFCSFIEPFDWSIHSLAFLHLYRLSWSWPLPLAEEYKFEMGFIPQYSAALGKPGYQRFLEEPGYVHRPNYLWWTYRHLGRDLTSLSFRTHWLRTAGSCWFLARLSGTWPKSFCQSCYLSVSSQKWSPPSPALLLRSLFFVQWSLQARSGYSEYRMGTCFATKRMR